MSAFRHNHDKAPLVTLTVEAVEPISTNWGGSTEKVILSSDRPAGMAAVSLLLYLGSATYDGMLGQADSAPRGHSRIAVEGEFRFSLALSWGLCPVMPGYKLSIPLIGMEDIGHAFHAGLTRITRAAWECLCMPGLGASALREAWRREESAGADTDTARVAFTLVDAADDDQADSLDSVYDDGFQEPPERVAQWHAVATEVGRARVRRTHHDTWDPNYGSGVIEVVLGDRSWSGGFRNCVDGHESFSLADISAASTPYLDVHGQDHAKNLDAFVQFALPLIVRGQLPHPRIGQPIVDGEADVAPAGQGAICTS